MSLLKIVGADGSRIDYELREIEAVIGRMPSCEINIGRDGHEVSRRHARLMRVDNDWYIEDLQSRNHTYVNGFEIGAKKPWALKHRDRIKICSYELQFINPDATQPDSGSVLLLDTPASEAISSISLARESVLNDSARLSVLLDLIQSLKNILSLDAVLADTLSALLRIFPLAQRGVIGFIDGDEFVPKWWKLRDPSKDEEINVSRTVIQHVVQRKEAILIENAPQELPSRESIYGYNIHSVMCAPLLDTERNVFGAFLIDSRSVASFSHDDLILMAAAAIQASLAIKFAKLHEQALQQQIIEKDLTLARDVQSEFLPKAPPDVPGYQFADYYEPARFIGGDYFDYVPLPGGRVAIVLGDVCGKGAPAALYMARMAMETRACLAELSDPAEVFGQLNRRLSTRFATVVMCVLDPHAHTVTIVNAGHRPPLRRRADGTLESLGESISNFPFGVDEDLQFESASYQLEPGESVSILSDGVEDSHNAERDEYFGVQGIESAIRAAGGTAKDVVDELVSKVREFSANTTQLDDMCIVTISRTADHPDAKYS